MDAISLIYADSERCADMLYATQLFCPDPFIWARVGDQALVIVSALEVGRARSQIRPGTQVYSMAEAVVAFAVEPRRPESPQTIELLAGLARHYHAQDFRVPSDFPLKLARDLEGAGFQVTPVDGTLFPEREVKSPDEVAHLTVGVRLAEAGLNHGLEILRASTIVGDVVHWQGAVLTAEILRGEIDAQIARLGGVAAHTIVASGRHGADPHDGGTGPILAHHPLVLDIFPRVTATGYFGDLTRTVVKGIAPDIVKRAFVAVRDARDHAKTLIHAGAIASHIHGAVKQYLTDAGFPTDDKANPPHGFFHGTGHGLGLEIHEAPRLSIRDNILKAGQVVTVEPGVYYPEWGGLRLEDVVVVEANGCRCLTVVPDYLEIP